MKKQQYKTVKKMKRNSKSNIVKTQEKSKKMKKIIEINKKMSFGEIINRCPESANILMANGMHCFGCSMAMYETLEQGALMHGVNPDKLVKQINKIMKKNK